MIFDLEAVFAKKGDALILHCGDEENPRWILIDGGVHVWDDFLEPCLEDLRTFNEHDQLPLELVMVSHIDADHIDGILKLMKSVARDTAPKIKVKTLWHNAFEKLSNVQIAEIRKLVQQEAEEEAEGGAASVNQGLQLNDLIKEAKAKGRLNSLNGIVAADDDFPDLVVANSDNLKPFEISDTGVKFTVLAPNTKRLQEYRDEWFKVLEKARKEELEEELKEEAEAAGAAQSLIAIVDPRDQFTFADKSEYNLASIVVLAESEEGKTMLLTGDATGADVVEGLVLAGHLPESALLDKAGRKADEDDPLRDVPTFHVDLLKVMHHGSPNNVTTGFFRRVKAKDYVISGDGDHGNPHTDTLAMLMDARAHEPFTIHFTLSEEQIKNHADVDNEKKQKGLARLDEWLEKYRDKQLTNPKLVFRKDDEASVFVTPAP